MEKTEKKVTIAVINYNGENVLAETFKSIYNLDSHNVAEVILVDNCSTDGSLQVVRENYPLVRILKTEGNYGPNVARNVAIHEAKSKLVFLMDNDIVLTKNVITLLEDALYKNLQAGVAGAQIRFYDNPSKVQYNGCNIHYIGAAISNPHNSSIPISVSAVSAGAMLLDCNKANLIGMFDEDFIFGWEDGDFTFRMTIAGYHCIVVPNAIVFHNSETKGIRFLKYQVRNRLWFILKNYNFRTIVFIMPAVFLYQLFILAFFSLRGNFIEYLKGIFSVFYSLPIIFKKRKKVMTYKKLSDKKSLSSGNIDMLGNVKVNLPIRIIINTLNLTFSIYWKLIKWLVK